MPSDFVMGLFYGKGQFTPETSKLVIDDNIRTKQMYAALLIGIMFLISILSLPISLVPGACLGGGPGGVTFAALPHVIWQMPVLLVSMISLLSLYFDSNISISAAVTWITVGWWFQSVLAIINFISFISLVLEINNVDSTLWVQNGGAWTIVLLVISIIYIPWGIWIVWRMYVLHADLVLGYELGWRPGMLTQSSAYEAPPLVPPPRQEGDGLFAFENDKTPPPPTPAPQESDTQARIKSRIVVQGVRVGESQKKK